MKKQKEKKEKKQVRKDISVFENDKTIAIVRYFDDIDNPNSQTFEIRKSDFLDNNYVERFDDYILFKHPETKKEFKLSTVAHQIRGINNYWIVKRFVDSVPIILCAHNDTLIEKSHSAYDMYNKTSSTILEKRIKYYQGKDKDWIMFSFSFIILVVLITLLCFAPAFLVKIANGG